MTLNTSLAIEVYSQFAISSVLFGASFIPRCSAQWATECDAVHSVSISTLFKILRLIRGRCGDDTQNNKVKTEAKTTWTNTKTLCDRLQEGERELFEYQREQYSYRWIIWQKINAKLFTFSGLRIVDVVDTQRHKLLTRSMNKIHQMKALRDGMSEWKMSENDKNEYTNRMA